LDKWLHELPDEMVIPVGVAQEIQRGAKNDVARRWLKNEGNTWVQEASVVIPLISTLGLGESQVLSYVQTHSDCVAIVDDRAARNCACTLKIPVRGTLGVLLLAKWKTRTNQTFIDSIAKCRFAYKY
jgi:predicted nucleic acid-binding protein